VGPSGNEAVFSLESLHSPSLPFSPDIHHSTTAPRSSVTSPQVARDQPLCPELEASSMTGLGVKVFYCNNSNNEDNVTDHNNKVKKSSPATRHGGAWGERSIAPTYSRPRHSMAVSGQHHAPAALLPLGKGPPVPIVQEAGLAPEPVWTQRLEEKSFAPAGVRTPIARSASP
jgi:hypothetical protein